MAQIPPLPPGGNQKTSQVQAPIVVQIDPKCLQSALKEFFEPLRTNDPQTDFFAVYRKESEDFDRDHAGKYDGDLNTSLIFAGLFSAVSSAFIINVQPKLEPDPNERAAAYMEILIHAVNASLFPNVDPNVDRWTGPPPEIVTVQSLLYASLATSLFAAFLAMLGKQWVSRYIQNRGGSTTDKSRNRQRKLDGLHRWHFHLFIECLPAMLQFALLLLGCALARYLWAISRTIAGVAIAATLFGVVSYIFFTLAATLFYDCPFQTPLSLMIRTLILHHGSTLIPLVARMGNALRRLGRGFRWFVQHLHSGMQSVASGLGCAAHVQQQTVHVALTGVALPEKLFEDVSLDWESCRADARCIAWMLSSTTDIDVILSTVHFAADTTWYPEIADTVSPQALADLFLDCLSARRVIPGKSEHAIATGMALGSILSIRLSMNPESNGLREVCERLITNLDRLPPPAPMFLLIKSVIVFVTRTPTRTLDYVRDVEVALSLAPKHLSSTFKIWLSRVILQTMWRSKRSGYDLAAISSSHLSTCERLVADGDPVPTDYKINHLLIMAISLGLNIDLCDLHAPNNDGTLSRALNILHGRLKAAIGDGVETRSLHLILSALGHLDLLQVEDLREKYISWIGVIFGSEHYSERDKYLLARDVMLLLTPRRGIDLRPPESLPKVQPTELPSLLNFLLFSERYKTENDPPYPDAIALRLLSLNYNTGREDFSPLLIPVLTSTLSTTRPLLSRIFALKLFQEHGREWLSPQMGKFSDVDRSKLLEALGDPFDFSEDPPSDAEHLPKVQVTYEPMDTAILLIGFASSNLWSDHLCRLNFSSCEAIFSTGGGRHLAFNCMLEKQTYFGGEFLDTPTKAATAIKRLGDLQCPNTAQVVQEWTTQ